MSSLSPAALPCAIGLYADHVRYLRALTLADSDVRAGALAGMREIAAAVRAGDAAEAARAMQAQLERAKRALFFDAQA